MQLDQLDLILFSFQFPLKNAHNGFVLLLGINQNFL